MDFIIHFTFMDDDPKESTFPTNDDYIKCSFAFSNVLWDYLIPTYMILL